MKKGNNIYQFLQKCLENLRKEEVFAELKVASADQLMYIKEDLILPHHSTFFEFIVTKARGRNCSVEADHITSSSNIVLKFSDHHFNSLIICAS